MSDTDAANLSVAERRKLLLRQRLRENGLTTPESAATASRACAGEHYPLSAGQRRMWFMQTRDPEDTTLTVCVAYLLAGALDADRLHAAIDAVVARHDILRTRYAVGADGEPYQTFAETGGVAWQFHDVTDLPEQARAPRVEVLARREFGRPFDLAAEPPLRVTLVRTGATEFALLLAVHHICWDDDSWAVFFAEVNAAYNAERAVAAASSVDARASFVATAVLDGPAEPADADVDYWRAALRPLPEPLDLLGSPTAAPSRQAARRTRAVPAELLARVEAFARERSATPFMVLLAAFDALIHRYTAASDFLVAVPVTERRAGTQDLIGYFGNTLLLRAAVRSSDTFAAVVDAVRETCLAGFAHQGVGIDRVVREANPERAAGRDGMDQLVRLGFSVRKSADGFDLDGVAARRLPWGAPSAQVPLALAVALEPDGACLEIEYQTEVLAAELVERMLGHYARLLEGALATPDVRLGELDMLGPAERAAILEQSHGDLIAAPATTMVALLETAAATRPDALALVSDETELTYTALHRRANRLAHRLIALGIGAEDIVGLRMGGSVEFVVAVLGVLKAGAAYLPIDPAYPRDRIDYLMEDARPALVLGPGELAAAESAAADLPDTAPTDADRRRPLLPAHLAYVIYTSGSTGKPKGVAVAHAAIAEHVESFTAEWGMTAEDRLLQSSSVSFDASLLDIFVTLALGARLIVPRPDAFRDIRYVADLVTRRGVTVLHMVPSMLGTFLLLPEVSEWRTLRHVPVGGEALPGEVADKFSAVFDAELRNHYGPTEAVVCATHMPVEGPQGTGVVPIGVPNRNVYTYVLDENLHLAPTGVVGELYLGGYQLARGYRGRPALTAQRFVADPFTPGARLYRSGDLVRRNEFGELEFVGRADEQVKVRGFRIEPGEVEAVVAAHPAVARCVVLVAEDATTGPVLVAYLVAAADSDVDVDQVRAHAAERLPEYMVPSAFAVIPEIPLTVNGKLDRRALPAPTPAARQEHREPATATERRLCAIFAALFGDERIGADDSFFDLGGHSLLAARLVARIRADFGVEVDVRAIFDTPTPAGLAARLVARFRDEFAIDLDAVEREMVAAAESTQVAAPECAVAPPSAAPASTTEPRPALRPRRATEPDSGAGHPPLAKHVLPERIPLSYSQLAMWFQHRMEGPSEVGNLPFAMRFDGPLVVAALAAALGDVVARHAALRANFREHEGVPYQIVHPAREIELPVTAIAPEDLEDTLARVRRHTFAIESEPLIRPALLALGPHSHVLALLVHHMVADHVSLGILLDDLITAYRARVRGDAPRWEPLPIQYPAYALWQRETFGRGQSPHARAEIEHWRGVLAGLPDEISVAFDRPRPAALGTRAEVVTFTVPAERCRALAALAGQSGVSEFMVYQAAAAVLLHKLGGGVDIALGTPVAARTDPALGTVVGLFANMVVLRNDLAGDPTLRELVTRSRDTVLDAYEHQDLPIERLVEALNPPRSRSRNPLFQSMIHFRGQDWAPAPRVLTDNVTVTVLPVDFDVSFLDVNLSLTMAADGSLAARVVVNADLYDAPTARLIAEALDATLHAFAVAPDRALSEVAVLPPADSARLLAPPVPAAPSTRPSGRGTAETERTLIALLEELLEIEGVEAEDNFFALGGDSVISIQWAARAAELGLALTPQLVFEHMTLGDLAAALDATGSAPRPDGEHRWQEHAPMSASGLDADALAALTTSWQARS